MNKKIKLKIYFTISFIILFILILTTLNTIKHENIQTHLKDENDLIYLKYKVIYNNSKNIAELIYKTHIQDEKILTLFSKREREELKNYIHEKYNKLRVFNIRQLHFHLPNNDSFLRMHRPNKFGDNLTQARKTVDYVNKYKKYIHGFEEGKIFNGFRFVYPLSLNNKHIGSVEVSFSALYFIQEIAKSYNLNANLLIKKEIVDKKVFKNEKSNYSKSPLEGFYYQNSIIEKLKLSKYKRVISDKLKTEILSNMEKNKPFAIFVSDMNELAHFIPLKNPITKQTVAYLKINKVDNKISKIKSNFRNYLILSTLLILIIMIFLYTQFNYQSKLEQSVEEKTKSLNDLNKNLKEAVEKEVNKNRIKDEIMIAQSRHAAMGEMISMIAHQWRQPLTSISMDVNNILADIELEMLDINELKETSSKIIIKTQYLSKTVDDFRNFFKPEKKAETVYIKDIIQDTLNITKSQLENHNVNISIDCKSPKPINTYSRELLQVFINIIKNAEEALSETNLKDKKIDISCSEDNESILIEFYNNGDQIKEEIIERIFEPYFSTKSEKSGTGLGLYMCKTIVEKHLKGELSFQNEKEGVVFKIKLPFDIKESI